MNDNTDQLRFQAGLLADTIPSKKAIANGVALILANLKRQGILYHTNGWLESSFARHRRDRPMAKYCQKYIRELIAELGYDVFDDVSKDSFVRWTLYILREARRVHREK